MRTHGHTRGGRPTGTYRSWSEMIARCDNPKSKIYSYYGGRGISICERWRSFENFLEDMGERQVGQSLDRIDNDGNYEPGNCRWASKKDQARNRRSNCLVTYNGTKMSLSEAAELEGIPYWQAYKFADDKVIEQRKAYKREWARRNRPSRRRASPC